MPPFDAAGRRSDDQTDSLEPVPVRAQQTPDLAKRLEAVEKLTGTFASPHDASYLRLEAGMDQLAPSLREATRRCLLEVRRTSRRWDVLSSLGTEEPPRISTPLRTIAEDLRQGDLATRLQKIEVLVQEEAFEAAPVLATRLVVEFEPLVAAALARAVGFLGGNAVLVVLKKAARHSSRDIRLGAVEGLRHQSSVEALRLLVERLGDSEEQVRQAALEALGSRSPASVLSILAAFPAGRGGKILRGALPWLRSWNFLAPVQEFGHSRGLPVSPQTRPPPRLEHLVVDR